MSYCRFRNTLSDLRDCADHFEDENLSDDEHYARRKMVTEMIDILSNLGADIDSDNIDEEYFDEYLER